MQLRAGGGGLAATAARPPRRPLLLPPPASASSLQPVAATAASSRRRHHRSLSTSAAAGDGSNVLADVAAGPTLRTTSSEAATTETGDATSSSATSSSGAAEALAAAAAAPRYVQQQQQQRRRQQASSSEEASAEEAAPVASTSGRAATPAPPPVRQQQVQKQQQQVQQQPQQQQQRRRDAPPPPPRPQAPRLTEQQLAERAAAQRAAAAEAEAAIRATHSPPPTLPQLLGAAVDGVRGKLFNGARPPPELGRGGARAAAVAPLPQEDWGALQGGAWPFAFDPVYGLPIVRDVATYARVLRDIRTGDVRELLWFVEPGVRTAAAADGRCLVRYTDGRVAQAVVPPTDARLVYAMEAHGVRATQLPSEPRHVARYSGASLAALGGPGNDDTAARQWFLQETDVAALRRGPRLGPSYEESVVGLMTDDQRRAWLAAREADVERVAGNLLPADAAAWHYWKTGRGAKEAGIGGAGGAGGGSSSEAAEYGGGGAARAARRAAAVAQAKQSWSDRIIVSQDVQVLIYKWVPIIGPVLGSAFVIGLYVAARLLRGDLTDRMKLMDEGEEKRRRTALREARVAFLEEEVPALVARGAPADAIRKKAADVNKRLGEKFEISEAELSSTIDACVSLLSQGQDLDLGDGSSTAAERILAEEDAAAMQAAQGGAEGGGEGQQQNPADALMEMGKLNTARIRKAVDPRILDVKKRVRAARRSLKRESKVVLSDEIIFFDDVAGNAQAKVELMEVVDFFRQPEKFRASGARPPKGVLLVGPPGNGKTLMARAVAGESGVAFISSSASEFIEMYMGLGAARVRDLFATARKLSPCIIFIDELDAVGRARRSGQQGGNDERDNTVNQLLTELDGFAAETQGIVVMGATNRKDVLDPALTRPGRFDRSIEVRRPDYAGRLEGIRVHLREKPIAGDIDYAALAALTGGMSGAQLAGVCNTACFLASRAGRTEVTQLDLVAAVEQTKYGRTYESARFVSPARKQRFAVIEAGFCVAAALLPAIEPIDYATILPSAKSPVGRTVLKPNVGRYTTGVWTRAYLEQQLRLVLAGRAAEELVFGREELSSLHQHKLMMARQVTHRMLNAGMSSHPDFEHIRGLGSTYLDGSMEPGRFSSYTTVTDWSQTRAEWVDVDIEMEDALNGAYEEVKGLLGRNRGALDAVAAALLKEEHMRGEAIYAVVDAALSPADLAARRAAQAAAEAQTGGDPMMALL